MMQIEQLSPAVVEETVIEFVLLFRHRSDDDIDLFAQLLKQSQFTEQKSIFRDSIHQQIAVE